jgi:hypothetical protein
MGIEMELLINKILNVSSLISIQASRISVVYNSSQSWLRIKVCTGESFARMHEQHTFVPLHVTSATIEFYSGFGKMISVKNHIIPT